MAHQVPWNKYIVERFEEAAMLTDLEREVLRTRVAGWSRTINGLKRKYDRVARLDPLLPPRKNSAAETWQDDN